MQGKGTATTGGVEAGAQPELLTGREVAQRLRLSEYSVRSLSRSGDLPAPLRVGRAGLRWERQDIEDYLDERRRAAREAVA